MALPTIAPYLPPDAADCPVSRAIWQIDPSQTALLIHDLQPYFLRPFDQTTEPVSSLLRNVAELRRLCERYSIPVFFSAQPGEQDRRERGLLWDIWGPGITTAPELSGFPKGFEPTSHNFIIEKRRYSAFCGTNFRSMLERLDRKQLMVTGIYGHIGCLATCTDAFMQDVQPFLVADAVADFSRDDHVRALKQVARTCGVVTMTDTIARALVEAQVNTAVRQLLDSPELEFDPDCDLRSLGLDSIRSMMLLERVLLPEPYPDFEGLMSARSARDVERLVMNQLRCADDRSPDLTSFWSAREAG